MLLVDGEARAGFTRFAAPTVTGVSASAGFEATDCCGLSVYISRSYLGDVDAPFTREEITDIGLGVTAILIPHLRLRIRGGLAGIPPHNQDAMRSGVAAGAAVLWRVWPEPTPPPLGHAAPHFDAVVGADGWSLGARRSSAGIEEDDSARLLTLTLGIRITADYGVDFH